MFVLFASETAARQAANFHFSSRRHGRVAKCKGKMKNGLVISTTFILRLSVLRLSQTKHGISNSQPGGHSDYRHHD
jgi:hypothetical protein